ncbi:MAG: O-antigen ligase family protein [Acidobacteria bacterium]|nr:O-antigen ligase family protein [Acidobacteriota bacterium]MBV9071222.1 O-antigen ligase family protein [Acidobacteriota bacterium]MBV9187844.1 O-antigen ligase family protein [Acidobacteriota bacterium]
MRNAVELVLFAALLAFLVWVPMPFGSASDASQAALILPALLIGCGAALLRAASKAPFVMTRPGRIWTTGGVLFVLVIALQLLPLPPGILALISPQSAVIWARATHVAALAGVNAGTNHPITIDPQHTALHFYRVLAYFAVFLASMILTRDTVRRLILAAVLGCVGIFEALYAVHEAALGRYAIWGWKNNLIFGRATGTFVNPNHFGHYAAIVLPMALYVSAYAWHTAAPAGATFGRRFVKLVERRFFPFAFGLLAALGCITAVLVSESRGAVLALIGGFALVGALVSDRKNAALRFVLIAAAVSAAVLAAILVLGRPGTVTRFETSQTSQVTARRDSVIAAIRIWAMFPLFGSGAGTYPDVALATAVTTGEIVPNHAHNDYSEILATTGALGFVVSLVPLLGGFGALMRNAVGPEGEPMSWRRRAFKLAALTSIAIAMMHALVDFNFFIPANPITLAAIAGAAVVAREL